MAARHMYGAADIDEIDLLDNADELDCPGAPPFAQLRMGARFV